MPMYGKIHPFEGEGVDWMAYLEQVSEYFIANDISDEKKKSIFLASCGSKCYAVLRNLISPESPGSKTYQFITSALTNYYAPTPSEIVSRYKFHTRAKSEGESVMSFVAELRNLAKYCNFGSVLEDMLRDRLVCGINNDKIQERLFAETTLSYTKAVKIAVAMETAFKDVASIQEEAMGKKGAEGQEANINRVFKVAADTKKDCGKTESEYKCFRCGFNHSATWCRHKGSKCFKCKKMGHVARVCQSEGGVKVDKKSGDASKYVKGKVNAISYQEGSDEEVYSLKSILTFGSNKRPPIIMSIKIQGQNIPMEVDTGAALSVMSKQSFDEQLSMVKTELKPSKVKLKGYFGQQIKAMGQLTVLVKYQDCEYHLPLCIVPGDGPTLMGRDWIEDLGLAPTLFVHQVSQLNSIEEVLDRFKEVFSEKLGTMKDVVARINMPDNARPRFFKSRPVPFALQSKIEAELDRLADEGILIPVRYSDWAAPIVAVPRSDGSMRITGDFKVTVNAVSALEQYPVPLIDELFAKLSGGKKFTKLDLRDAYFQMRLDEESQKFVTINTPKGLFQYTRLPQGLASAPAVFIRAMDGLLGDLKKVAVFFDDILITGKNDLEHLENLTEVLKRLEIAGLKLKRPKCGFMQKEITYLGYRLNQDGLRPTHEKVQDIRKAPEPQNIMELQAFLGLINHYR